jgi:hypothetical protein
MKSIDKRIRRLESKVADQAQGILFVVSRAGPGYLRQDSHIRSHRTSNLIEGIDRKPADAEFEAHKRFLSLDQIRIADLEAFVDVVAPGKKR